VASRRGRRVMTTSYLQKTAEQNAQKAIYVN
jgi:hypothetical protein